MKKRKAYKQVVWFTKTHRPHEMHIIYGCELKTGLVWNNAQGAWRYTVLATENEIESKRAKFRNASPKTGKSEPIREYIEWLPIGKNGKLVKRVTYFPNRSQRKHGITSAGFCTK